jgi:hypothetical protein
VWMTPGGNWREEYAGWPEAMAKLEYCARAMAEVGDKPPLVTDEDLDEDVSEIDTSLDDWYREQTDGGTELPLGLDGALRAAFADPHTDDSLPPTERPEAWVPAASLLEQLGRELMAAVYVWTGHFPERTRDILGHLRGRAEALELAYDPARERDVIIAVTTMVTALAMNHVHRGQYMP